MAFMWKRGGFRSANIFEVIGSDTILKVYTYLVLYM